MSTPPSPGRAESARWQGAAEVLRLVRRRPGVTRAAAAQDLGLTSGSAAEITARLRGLGLVDERPVRPTGRGRPTTALHAGPTGPLAAVIDIRHEDWTIAVADLDGEIEPFGHGRRPGDDPAQLVATLRDALTELRGAYGPRLRVVSVAAAGTVQQNRIVQASTLGWSGIDLTGLSDHESDPLPLLVGNDASLAGLAEVRRGAARTARTALYITIEVGIGGVLVGQGAATGATGAAGEFGHLPFGAPDLVCPCGASGCWDLEVDGRAMARHRGDPAPADPWSYAAATLADARDDPAAAEVVERCASALGRGLAGLVNALDPGAVTLGGFAVPLQRLAGDALDRAYTAGLMAFRRADPPPLRAASLGDSGRLLGAAEVAFDTFLTEEGLARWSRSAAPPS